MQPWRTILELIERDGAAALVTVVELAGSGPREAGARMVVAKDGTIAGTIGGGTLEFEAIDFARCFVRQFLQRQRKIFPHSTGAQEGRVLINHADAHAGTLEIARRK